MALLTDASLFKRKKSLSKFLFKRLYAQHLEEITDDILYQRKF